VSAQAGVPLSGPFVARRSGDTLPEGHFGDRPGRVSAGPGMSGSVWRCRVVWGGARSPAQAHVCRLASKQTRQSSAASGVSWGQELLSKAGPARPPLGKPPGRAGAPRGSRGSFFLRSRAPLCVPRLVPSSYVQLLYVLTVSLGGITRALAFKTSLPVGLLEQFEPDSFIWLWQKTGPGYWERLPESKS
jgi:hypothetical protein